MKYIIYIGVLFMPDKNAAAQRALAFAKIIRQLGYIPIIIGMNKEIKKENILMTLQENKDYILYEMKYPNTVFSWLKTITNCKSIIDIINYYGNENIKAIIGMDYFSVAFWKLMKYCKHNNIRCIADAVDWFEKSKYSFPKNIIKNLDTCIRMKILYKEIDYMIAISQFLYNYYKNKKSIVIIPGIVPDIKINKNEEYKASKIIKLAFIGSPGNNFEKERIDWLMHSIGELDPKGKKIKFYIAGVDKHIILEKAKKIISEDNYENTVVPLGKLKHNECINLLKKVDFSIIIREDNILSKAGFLTKLGEAFSCGTPVFATPTSNIKDYILQDYGVVTENCTLIEVKNSLSKILLMSIQEREKMHNAIKNYNPLYNKKIVTRINIKNIDKIMREIYGRYI